MDSVYYKEVKTAFNDWAATYEEDVVPKLIQRGYSYAELGKYIAGYIELVDAAKPDVLELGTGTGILGINVVTNAVRPVNLTGLDIADEMLKKASEKKIYQDLICSSADLYEFQKKFDIIYSGFMFHSVMDQRLLIDRISHSLNLGGYFLMIDLIPNETVQGHNCDYNSHSRAYEHGAPSNYKSNRELINLFNHCELQLVRVEQLGIDKDYNHFLYVLKK